MVASSIGIRMNKLELERLSLSFRSQSGDIQALDQLVFSIAPGQTFALLGESGCGKSMTASAIMQLLPQNAFCHKQSTCLFEGEDLQSFVNDLKGRYKTVKRFKPKSTRNESVELFLSVFCAVLVIHG